MSPVMSSAINVLIFVAMLPVAVAAGIFVVAAYRLAILQGHSATAAQVILGGLTFLGLGCAPVALLIVLPAFGVGVPDSLTATVVAAAGFCVWLSMGVIAWAIMYRRTGVHRRTGPPRRRYHYRRLAVIVVIVAVTACGLVWSALGPLWGLPFLAPAVYPVVTLLAYERRFRAQTTDPTAIPAGFALYLRWFGADQHPNIYPTSVDAARLGWVDSSGWVSLERLLSVGFIRRFGGFVALGSPQDVLPPGGATRVYFDDDAWQERLQALAVRAAVVVMEAGDTRWIEWELGMIRELGLQPRFFIVTPPGGDPRWSQLYRRVGHAVVSIVARLSRSTPPTWQGFSARLRNAGFEPPPEDPGPGCVLAVDGSRVVLLRAGLTSSDEFVATILARAPVRRTGA
jgi:Ca2+/Na+ antiporter